MSFKIFRQLYKMTSREMALSADKHPEHVNRHGPLFFAAAGICVVLICSIGSYSEKNIFHYISLLFSCLALIVALILAHIFQHMRRKIESHSKLYFTLLTYKPLLCLQMVGVFLLLFAFIFLITGINLAIGTIFTISAFFGIAFHTWLQADFDKKFHSHQTF